MANRGAEFFFDTHNYIEMAERAAAGFDVNAEFSFIHIANSSFATGAGVIGVFFTYAFLGIIPKIFVIFHRLPYSLLALIIYLSGSFILQEMVQIRVGAALGMLWLSAFLFSDGRKSGSFLAASLGIFLHYSAFAVVVAIIVARFAFWKRYFSQGRLGNAIIWFGLIAIAISYYVGWVAFDLASPNSFLHEYLPVRYADGYLVPTEERYGSGKILFVIFLSLVAMCSVAKGWLPKEFPYLVAAISTYSSIFVLTLFQSQPVVGSRLVDMFLTFVPILIVGIIKVKPRYGWLIFASIAAAQIVNIIFYANYYKAFD